MNRFIGIDIGGTNIVCGIVRADESLAAGTHAGTGAKEEAGLQSDADSLQTTVLRTQTEHLLTFSTEAALGSIHVLGKLREKILELCAEAGLSLSDIEGIGMGVPGFVDPEKGVSLHAVNLGWRDIPVAAILRNSLGYDRICIDNDVRMYIYGEAMSGAGAGYRHVLGVTLGTGLAAAMVHDGRLYYGAGNRAGELGHIPVDGNDVRCNCGMIGCLETIASATGIARQALSRLEKGEASVLREWFPAREDWPRITAADVSRGQERGDGLCAAVLEYTGTQLGRGLAAAVPLLSPDVIIVGGGAALAGEPLLGPVRREIRSRVQPVYADHLRVLEAVRPEDAGVVGSALYAMSRMRA